MTTSDSLVSKNFSELKFISSKFKRTILKSRIWGFSKSINYFDFKFFRITITDDTVRSSSCLSYSGNQISIATTANSKSENFGIIVISANLFTVINNIVFVPNLPIS